ncbi:hypothetical protein GCM10010965_32070 [Caldalkalibacillus thermarum]|nr:hypothetical protein GCM10010965_32070 [Caldalkalibacillus thermarum]
MAYQHSTLSFEQMLLQFMSEQDPMLAMLRWHCEQMMEAEVTAKTKAQKSERTDTRTGYRSGYRVRHLDETMIDFLMGRLCSGMSPMVRSS